MFSSPEHSVTSNFTEWTFQKKLYIGDKTMRPNTKKRHLVTIQISLCKNMVNGRNDEILTKPYTSH